MSELRFVAPDLRRLDESDAELVACGVFRDERPFRGLAGLLDCRFAGRLSRLAREGFVVGDVGEAVLLPARARLPADKLLVLGLGARDTFDEDAFRRVLARALDAIAGLAVKRALVELPGRGADAMAVARAAALLFEVLPEDQRDALTLVEAPEHRAVFEDEEAEARRRTRRDAARS